MQKVVIKLIFKKLTDDTSAAALYSCIILGCFLRFCALQNIRKPLELENSEQKKLVCFLQLQTTCCQQAVQRISTFPLFPHYLIISICSFLTFSTTKIHFHIHTSPFSYYRICQLCRVLLTVYVWKNNSTLRCPCDNHIWQKFFGKMTAECTCPIKKEQEFGAHVCIYYRSSEIITG